MEKEILTDLIDELGTNFFIGKTNFETTVKLIENKLLEEIMNDIKEWKKGHNGE